MEQRGERGVGRDEDLRGTVEHDEQPRLPRAVGGPEHATHRAKDPEREDGANESRPAEEVDRVRRAHRDFFSYVGVDPEGLSAMKQVVVKASCEAHNAPNSEGCPGPPGDHEANLGMAMLPGEDEGATQAGARFGNGKESLRRRRGQRLRQADSRALSLIAPRTCTLRRAPPGQLLQHNEQKLGVTQQVSPPQPSRLSCKPVEPFHASSADIHAGHRTAAPATKSGRL